MKQHITLQQWDEITKAQKNVLWDSGFQRDWKMDIGQMIKFLKDDLCNINCDMNIESSKAEYNARIIMYTTKCFDFETRWYIELVDALWEAVKYKLNN